MNSFKILCLVKGKITDWKFGFDDDEDLEDDYYTCEFDNNFNIDDIIPNQGKDINEDENIFEIKKPEKIVTKVKKSTPKKAASKKKAVNKTK